VRSDVELRTDGTADAAFDGLQLDIFLGHSLFSQSTMLVAVDVREVVRGSQEMLV
jgi:hypothetical protein